MALKIYLAGPDVFLPGAQEIARKKRQICAELGFEGLFPLDNELATASPQRIFEANCTLMRKADIGLFNCSPFRGPSADAGTAFELGFFFHAGKAAWGYSYSPTTYRVRVNATIGARKNRGRVMDSFGYLVEDFDLADNLMLIKAIQESGGKFIAVEEPAPTLTHDALAAFSAFRECVETLSREISRRGVDSLKRRRVHGRFL